MTDKSLQQKLDRLEQVLAEKDEEIRSLIDACRKVTSSLNVEEVLLVIQQAARRLMNAESSSVILLDSSGEYLQIASSTGTKEDAVKGLRFPSDKGIAGWVIQNREPVMVNDVDSDPRFYAEIDQQSGYRTEGVCCAPMVFRDKMLGVIEVLNYKNSGDFPASRLELFTTFADLAAVALKNAISFDDLAHSYKLLSEQARSEGIYHSKNRKMKQVYEMCAKVAPLESTVFLRGDSGTGKELLADLIHSQSGRKDKPLVKVNVAALPENLVESELFGHEKGAFTGAVSRKRGKFELADRGTIFLDEIGELQVDTQVKLLRFLQEHTFERLGGNETVKVDVRIIAASNRNMDEAINSGKFRTDLFYRLNVVPLEIPPLRERTEDIPLLVDFFIGKFNSELNRKVEGISPDALNSLLDHSWPGNIRELENIIERIMVMREQGVIMPEDIPAEICPAARQPDPASGEQDSGHPARLHDMEQRIILETLEANGYNQSRTARKLGITLNQLRYRIKRYGIEIKKH
ncbi:MAG: GAF domain-containing protein [Candidatus Glassbacteria bacterium]|nr:GAF domain-containing protein [Candidatus Glassbacteria bacterium]